MNLKNIFRFLGSFISPLLVEKRQSSISSSLEVNYVNGKYVLDTARVNYSFAGLHEVFQNAFANFNIQQREIKDVLILGFGAGSVAHILKNEYGKDVRITGVEIDKTVLDLARKYFGLHEDDKLKIHHEHVLEFMQNNHSRYDLVVVDVFVDFEVPKEIQEEEFIVQLGKSLSPNGILFYNYIARDASGRDHGGKLYQTMTRLLGTINWVRQFAKSTENWIFVFEPKSKLDA